MTPCKEIVTSSSSLGALQPSLTLSIAAQAKAMAAVGEDVVSLSAGEPDFDTPEHIKDAAKKALDAGDTKYTPAAGKAELRGKIAEKLSQENGIPCNTEQVVVAPGAKFSVFSAIATLCRPEDEVIVPAPYWLSYPEMVRATGATCVTPQTTAENGYCLTPQQLAQSVSPRTKLLVLNTPSNPAGAVYPRQYLEAIADLAVTHNFVVIADEIYETLVYGSEHQHVSIASLNEDIRARTVTVNGFSKAYSMTGWRLGYLTGPDWVVAKIKALQSHTTSNPTSFAQAGGLAALDGSEAFVGRMHQAFKERLECIYQRLADIKGLTVSRPQGAFYIFPDISSFGLDSMTFVERLLNEEKLAIIPGKPFGADNNVRLSYACSTETIKKGCNRLANFCRKLSDA